MYVDHVFSRETADAIGNSHVWITNEYEHWGLRVGGPRGVGRLLYLVRGLARRPQDALDLAWSRTPCAGQGGGAV